MTLPQTIARPPETPLQRAIVARLRGDSQLATLLAAVKGISPSTPAVVDQVKEGQAYPYVRIGDHLSIGADDLTSFGRQVTVTLHVWTKTNSMGPGQAVADRIVALLHRQHEALSGLLVADGHRCVFSRWEFGQALEDPDPELRHHVVRFRIETAQLT